MKFNFKRISDEQLFLIFNYQQWGYLLLVIILLWPTIIFLKSKMTEQKIFDFLLIVTLVYFFVLTRMHERYLAPAVVFATILAFKDKKYWIILISISFIYLLNLYRGLYQPNIAILNTLVDSMIYLKTFVVIYAGIILYNIYTFLRIK